MTATPMLTAWSQKPTSNESLPDSALSRRLAAWSSEPSQVSPHAATAPARKARSDGRSPRVRPTNATTTTVATPPKRKQDRAQLQAAPLRHQQLVVERDRPLSSCEPVVREEATRHEQRRTEQHNRVAEGGAACSASTSLVGHHLMMSPASAIVEPLRQMYAAVA
jgi:hypothetical protein